MAMFSAMENSDFYDEDWDDEYWDDWFDEYEDGNNDSLSLGSSPDHYTGCIGTIDTNREK